MKIYDNPPKEIWAELCARPVQSDEGLSSRVGAILERVRLGGDGALRELALEIEGKTPASLEFSAAEIEAACSEVSPEVKAAVKKAAANIEAFHRAQLPPEVVVETAPGVKCIQKPVPIAKVGLYIPGGTAPLFSTILMLAIPARIAGCSEVILCTPAQSAEVLYAASYCGIKRIFKVGGAQAVAAMAYGTTTVPRVDKIFGPGNRYVTAAKQMLGLSRVAIDMPAGPSEVMVIADDGASPAFVAADLLSQAEHGMDSQVMLVCRSSAFAEKVQREMEKQTAALDRSAFVQGALSSSRTIIFQDNDSTVAFAEAYAPEHLIINTAEPWETASRITAAGSVFVGSYSPESAGDYASGTNHTLPTCGWARSFSGVNIDSFMRKMTIQELTRKGLQGLSGTIISMAEAEGLQAHANAVKVRLDGND